MFKFRLLTKATMAVAVAMIAMSPLQPAMAQEAVPTGAQIPVAIGIVNIQSVVAKSAAGQSLKKQADQQRKQIQTDLLAKEKQLRVESEQLNGQKATLPSAEFQQKAQALQGKLNAWRQGGEQKRKSFETAYNAAQKQIFETLQKVIGEIAVQKRLTLVLNKSVVIVSAQAWDISDSALAQLNKVLPAVKM